MPGVDADQVGFGDVKVQLGLAQGIVLGLHEPFGFFRVFGAEAGPVVGVGVKAIERAATFTALEQTESLFHTRWRSSYEGAIPTG